MLHRGSIASMNPDWKDGAECNATTMHANDTHSVQFNLISSLPLFFCSLSSHGIFSSQIFVSESEPHNDHLTQSSLT